MSEMSCDLPRIRRGNYRVHMDVTGCGEIEKLQNSIKEMAESLHQLTSDLENKVLSRTRELEDARNEAVKDHLFDCLFQHRATTALFDRT
jgi:nitrate/nitrite-specific signal transduction histidine kinase